MKNENMKKKKEVDDVVKEERHILRTSHHKKCTGQQQQQESPTLQSDLTRDKISIKGNEKRERERYWTRSNEMNERRKKSKLFFSSRDMYIFNGFRAASFM